MSTAHPAKSWRENPPGCAGTSPVHGGPGSAARLVPGEALAKGESAILGKEKGAWQREGELFE